jgi:flagellar hook-length control protein FliK
VKGGETMKVGMLYQPMNLPIQSQKRVENRETNNHAGNFFQQLLLQVQEKTPDRLAVNQAESENALEQLLAVLQEANETDDNHLFNTELFQLIMDTFPIYNMGWFQSIIESLPKDSIEKVVEQLPLEQALSQESEISGQKQAIVMLLALFQQGQASVAKMVEQLPLEQALSQESEISEQKQAIAMLMALFQQGQASASKMDEQTATKGKHPWKAVMQRHLSTEEPNAMEFIREFLVKLKNNKEGHFSELLFAGRVKDSQILSKGSAETLRNLLYPNNYTIQHQLKNVINQAEADSLENMSLKNHEIDGQMLTDYGMLTTSVQSEKGPMISLSESAPKTMMSQQFVQQFMQIMQTSKFTRLGNGQSQLVVRLHPEHLGSLTIKLVQEKGELMAKIIASTTSAKELIESNIQQIRHVIPTQNIIIEKFDVFTQQPFEQAFYDQQQERREQRQTHDNQKERSKKENDRTFTIAFEEELLNLEA